jgi:hypothetical protein
MHQPPHFADFHHPLFRKNAEASPRKKIFHKIPQKSPPWGSIKGA